MPVINETINMSSEEIWDQYGDMIYKVCHRAAEKFSMPFEEMLSDAVAYIWKNMHRFNPEKAKLSTWLYREAYYACLDCGEAHAKQYNRFPVESQISSGDEEGGFFDTVEADDEGFIERLSSNLSEDAIQLLHTVITSPEELDEALTVRRKVSGRNALKCYMIDVLDWTTPKWERHFQEIQEELRRIA